MTSGLLLVGGGGHCRSVIDVLMTAHMPIAGIIQGPEDALTPVLGYPSIGHDDDLPRLRKQFSNAIVTVGQIKNPASALPKLRASPE